MKQALISLFRVFGGGVRAEAASLRQVALPELSVSEMRKVSGGAIETCGPRGSW